MELNTNYLMNSDPEIFNLIKSETVRQESCIELIASENFVSKSVLEAQGSVLTNKYAEGYPGKRYYCGCNEIDFVESLAIERAKTIFKCLFVNVQPHSGSQANQAVYLSLLKPGDTILGMSLNSGGHLTHGASPNISGKWFNCKTYDVDKNTYLIDYDNLEKLAITCKPKLIIAGFSCYSRSLNFKRFREIADLVNAYLMVDIAHIAGLIVTGHHESPFPYAHVVTSTTHKTLRGPRGGIIMSNDQEIIKKINSSIFPGLQGGPLMHVIAAKAVAFKEASTENFKNYISQVIKNAKILGQTLKKRGYDILTDGTDNHIIILDLRKYSITGKLAAETLDKAGITTNKNSIPFDTLGPFITSGIRLGTAACTTRGFLEKEFEIVGNYIADILDVLQTGSLISISEKIKVISDKSKQLTLKFPIYF